MRRLQVVLHLVRSRELLAAHRTGEDLALRPLVVQEGVSLETVLVLERLGDVLFGAFRALVHPVADDGVLEEIQSAHTHLGQLLGRIVVRAARLPADPSSNLWARRVSWCAWHTSATLRMLQAGTGHGRVKGAAATHVQVVIQRRALSSSRRRRWRCVEIVGFRWHTVVGFSCGLKTRVKLNSIVNC